MKALRKELILYRFFPDGSCQNILVTTRSQLNKERHTTKHGDSIHIESCSPSQVQKYNPDTSEFPGNDAQQHHRPRTDCLNNEAMDVAHGMKLLRQGSIAELRKISGMFISRDGWQIEALGCMAKKQSSLTDPSAHNVCVCYAMHPNIYNLQTHPAQQRKMTEDQTTDYRLLSVKGFAWARVPFLSSYAYKRNPGRLRPLKR